MAKHLWGMTVNPARFWRKVLKTESCWLWRGAMTASGYGSIAWGRRGDLSSVGAHRFSYEMHVGPVPDGLWVLHRCDVRACVRPDHLFLGTCQDNHDDCHAKDRHNRGERNGRAKLTVDEISEIKGRLGAGYMPATIAVAYGVTADWVREIRRGRRWGHVSEGAA